MNSKIYVTQDDSEIIDYLTDAGIVHKSDNEDRVFAFLLGESYNLVIFFSEEGDKGFILFRIDQIKNNLIEVSNLKSMLLALYEATNQRIIKLAITQVEQMEILGSAAEIFKKGRS